MAELDLEVDDEADTTDADILEDALADFKRASEHSEEIRKAWLDDVRFARLGEQWPEKDKKKRESEGRPCLTVNRLPAFIRQVTNDARQNKPAIRIHPVGDGANVETAEIQQDLIRNIEYRSNADVAYDTALDHAVSGGFGYFRVDIDYACNDAFEKDIRIERIANPLTVYGDSDSTCADSADWNKAFVTEVLTRDKFKQEYPDAKSTLSWMDDQADRDELWYEEDKIRVAEYWVRKKVTKTLLKLSDDTVMMEDDYLTEVDEISPKAMFEAEGVTVVDQRPTETYVVTQYILTGAEVIKTTEWAGQYIPIIPVYGDEVMVEGKRTFNSLIRFAKDPQQMFNYWRTVSTELVALAPKAPFIGPLGAFVTDADKWSSANTDTHAYIEYDGEIPPQRQPFTGVPAGALQEALNAADDMKSIMGIYDASLGAKGNETSGVAITARQREGDVGTFNFIDNLSRAIRHLGRVIVDLIPHVYNKKRIIRVIHEDGTNEQVTINAPHIPPPAEPGQSSQPVQPPQGPNQGPGGLMIQPPGQGMPQQGMQPPQQPQTPNPILKVYDLTSGKYDVTVESGPSYTTKREDAANQMVEFVRAFPNAVPVIGDLVAKNLDWPGADDIAERLKALLPPQLQGSNPMVDQLQQAMQQQHQQATEAVQQLQGQLQQLTQKLQQAQIAQANDQQANLLKGQELQIKSKEAETKQYQAETARLELQKQSAFEAAQVQGQTHPEQLDRYKAELDYRKAIEVAEISAGATLQSGQAQAAANAARAPE